MRDQDVREYDIDQRELVDAVINFKENQVGSLDFNECTTKMEVMQKIRERVNRVDIRMRAYEGQVILRMKKLWQDNGSQMSIGAKSFTNFYDWEKARFGHSKKMVSEMERWAVFCQSEPALVYLATTWNWISKHLVDDVCDESLTLYHREYILL